MVKNGILFPNPILVMVARYWKIMAGIWVGVLLLLIKDYEDRTVTMPEIDVLEIIKEKMKEQGLKNKDMEPIIGSKGHVSSILSGRRDITLKMAQRLKDYFKLPAEVFLHSAQKMWSRSKRYMRNEARMGILFLERV